LGSADKAIPPFFHRSDIVFTKTKLPSSLKAICLAAALCAGAAAQAAVTVYTNQTDFVNAVVAPGTDTFDDLLVQPYPETLYRNAGSYTYQAYSGTGLWGAGGTGGDYWLSNNDRRNPIVFSNFSGNVSALGGYFFPSNVNGQFTEGSVVVTAIDGTVTTYNLNNATTGSFLGFVSDTPLTSVVLGTDGGAYWPTANNLMLAVPEPATYGMMLAGMALVGVAARRRKD
jgi:hypothetical protein